MSNQSEENSINNTKPTQGTANSFPLRVSTPNLKSWVKSLKKKNAGLLNTYFKDLVCPIETSKLLLIVCKASSDEKYQKILQNDKSLLIESIFLLKMMHDTEKSNGSLHKKDSEIIEDSPINGFKCNLVRLIGNLTYRNKANQDEVCIFQNYYILWA